MRPVAIVQHDPFDGPAYFATWLAQQGLGFELWRMFEGQRLPEDLVGYSGLCLLGGPMSANDTLAYYPQLFALVRQAVQKNIPVIGHCLGGQLLSRALGGTVQAVGPNGVLVDVVQPVSPNAPNTYPNYLRVNEIGAPSGNVAYMQPGEVTAWRVGAGTYAQILATGIYMTDGATSMDLPISALTVNVGFREFTGCNSGAPGNYIPLASDFY